MQQITKRDVGCWVDGSHWSSEDLIKEVAIFAANFFGYDLCAWLEVDAPNTLYDSELDEVDAEGLDFLYDDVVDHLNSLCDDDVWFETYDNSLFLTSEDSDE